MRKVGDFRNEKLSEEQYWILVDFIACANDMVEAESLVKLLFTESEIAAIGQRLAILRMIAKDFTYSQIEEKLKTSTNTITKVVEAQRKEKILGKYFDQMLKSYNYKPEKFQKYLQKLYPEKLPTAGVGLRAFLREQERQKKKFRNKNR